MLTENVSSAATVVCLHHLYFRDHPFAAKLMCMPPETNFTTVDSQNGFCNPCLNPCNANINIHQRTFRCFFLKCYCIGKGQSSKHGHKKAAMTNLILQQPNITIHPPPQLQEKNWIYHKTMPFSSSAILVA